MNRYNKAKYMLEKINMGWNLGNFLDAHDHLFSLQSDFKCKTVEEVVKLWKNPIFNLECLSSLKKVGINCIRIPITWCNFINIEQGKISLSQPFLTFVKAIIDKAIQEKFVVILDMHHDDQTWLKVACSKKEFKNICKTYRNIWSLIAYSFKDYGENLIFEGMNEIIDRTDPNYYDWVGKNAIFFKRLSKLYDIFIKQARKFSVENKKRTLMISTYGAQIHEVALKNFVLPRDRNLIVDLHFYSKHTDLEYYQDKFKYIRQYFIDKHIPIVLGEIGAKKGYEDNLDIIKVYKEYADSLNIKCVLWDNGTSRKFIDRKTGEYLVDFSKIL